MKKLSEKSYWDSIYQSVSVSNINSRSVFSRIKGGIKHITRDYSNYMLWEVLCKKYLPYNSEYKIIEVGCAPGKYLTNFHRVFGYIPYGVEYSEKGVEITKEHFKKMNLDSEGVIYADFFDEGFQNANKEKYDVVFSRGFIEHFDDVKRVVGLHSNLIKKGGYMVITIPNLNGINQVIAKMFNRYSYDLHNVSIMNNKAFTSLFSEEMFDKLYCGYVGIFSIGLFNTDKKWKYYVYRVLLLLQRPVDFLMRVLFRDTFVTSKYTSPYLVCIAQKK